MEQLSILEKKLALLIDSKKKDLQRLQDVQLELEHVTEENVKLRDQLEEAQLLVQNDLVKALDENALLRTQIEKLETTLLTRHESLDALSQERELAKMAVDDLIRDIDAIVEEEQQQ